MLKALIGRGVRKSYGQFGEDAIIQALVKGVRKGSYVDVGCYHPVLYSNTYGLYRKGWKGIAIDPNADMGRLYSLMRPRDEFVNCGIGERGSGVYHMFSDGAYNTFDPSEAERRKAIPRLSYRGSAEVGIRPLKDVLAERGIRSIDVLNVDVEGRDMSVLESHDWSVRPRVVAIEAEGFDPDRPGDCAAYAFMRDRGYRLAGFSGLTLVWKDGV